MQDDAPADVTLLLHEWQHGSRAALERLIPLVYTELHALASRYMSREPHGHTLQTTALINEAYVKLAGQRQVRLAESCALLWHRGASDAAHPRRPRAA